MTFNKAVIKIRYYTAPFGFLLVGMNVAENNYWLALLNLAGASLLWSGVRDDQP